MEKLVQCRHVPQEAGVWEEVIYAAAVSTGFTLHGITEYPELEGTHPFWPPPPLFPSKFVLLPGEARRGDTGCGVTLQPMLFHDSLSQQETAVDKRRGLPRGTLGFIVPIYSYPAFPSSGMWVCKPSLEALLAHLSRNIARPQWKNIFITGSQCCSLLSSRY